jgi:pantoate--beta-alanine ligase
MIVVSSRAEVRAEVARSRAGGESLALVPTMGALHEGHLALVDRAVALADRVMVSVFVNPLQFGPEEDLEQYPRDLERDVELLAERGAHLVFAPSTSEMYPDGEPRVTVSPGPMGDRLCGHYRPGHFEGVLTVVARLFGLLTPDVAVFGQKDFQQAVLIRRMVHDLEMPVRIEVAPIVREEGGLAMSSRNAYLSPEERSDAVGLYAGLCRAGRLFSGGERGAGALISAVRDAVDARTLLHAQYVEIVDPARLEPVDPVEPGSAIVIAAHCGSTRLIDNLILEVS